MNVRYANTPTAKQERGATNLKLGSDLIAAATGRGLAKAAWDFADVSLSSMMIGKDAADSLADNPIYSYLQPKYANSGLAKAQLPIMNAGNYGAGPSNIFSSSVQARREAATNFNRS